MNLLVPLNCSTFLSKYLVNTLKGKITIRCWIITSLLSFLLLRMVRIPQYIILLLCLSYRAHCFLRYISKSSRSIGFASQISKCIFISDSLTTPITSFSLSSSTQPSLDTASPSLNITKNEGSGVAAYYQETLSILGKVPISRYETIPTMTTANIYVCTLLNV